MHSTAEGVHRARTAQHRAYIERPKHSTERTQSAHETAQSVHRACTAQHTAYTECAWHSRACTHSAQSTAHSVHRVYTEHAQHSTGRTQSAHRTAQSIHRACTAQQRAFTERACHTTMRTQSINSTAQSLHRRGALDAARPWCGYLATYPNQATVLTTKGFSLCRGRFRRGQSLGHSGKTRCRSSPRCARRSNTPPHRYPPTVRTAQHSTAQSVHRVQPFTGMQCVLCTRLVLPSGHLIVCLSQAVTYALLFWGTSPCSMYCALGGIYSKGT